MLQGPPFVLELSEDFACPTIEVFEAQQPLFTKLRHVYEKSDPAALDPIKGDYNEALSVEAFSATEKSLRKNEDLSKEKDVFFEEG